MGKKDHPAYGGKTTHDQPEYTPHLLPSLFEAGVYFLHEKVQGEHSVTSIRGKEVADRMLSDATERARSY